MRLERDRSLSHENVIGKCRTRQTRAYSITEKGQTDFVESIQTLRFLCFVSGEKIKKKV
jgi:predicted transcriptional regulator